MQVLIDQSGYDLQNVGDIAMLVAAVDRVRELAPDAAISVVCHDQESLDRTVPGTRAVRFALDAGLTQRLPESRRKGIEQLTKMLGPLPRIAGHGPTLLGLGELNAGVRGADLVLASGGGFVNDTWWWHAVGVMSVLRAAQHYGVPTAMFGQGLGPLTARVARRRCTAVFSRLTGLGLREPRLGPDLARALGAAPQLTEVTGDDALALAVTGTHKATDDGCGLGVNLRFARYAGATEDASAVVGTVVKTLLKRWDAAPVPLPVSYNNGQVDSHAIASYFGVEDPGTDHGSSGAGLDPAFLRESVAGCRAVVTGSYHAGVFALAQGIPAVCLVMSDYYRAKFLGLQQLFPETCWVVDCTGSFSDPLKLALENAWHTGKSHRDTAVHRAELQVELSQSLYERVLTRG